jgi:outer membrane protein TolC
VHAWMLVLTHLAVVLLLAGGAMQAQAPPLRISMDEAVGLALDQNPDVRLRALEIERSEAEIRGARGALLPQVSSGTGFSRQIAPIDPFIGTRAAELFGGDAAGDWVAFNERARTDGDPASQPIPLPEFRARQDQAFQQAGVDRQEVVRSPFVVPNQFQANVSLSQALLAPAAAAQVRLARIARDRSTAGSRHERVVTADTVRRAYLAALLAQERAEVVRRSVGRMEAALTEASRRLEAGVAPISDQLSAEVQVANLRSDLVEAELQQARASIQLSLSMGLPPTRPLVLTDPLAIDDQFSLADVPLEAAVARALDRRADFQEARLGVAGQLATLDSARALLRPRLNATVSFNLQGNVPDERTQIRRDALRPFDVDVRERGVFDSAFWGRGVTAGLQLQWNVFQGGEQRAQIARAGTGIREAEVRLEQLRNALRAEVHSGWEAMRAARRGVTLQQRNVEVAERLFEIMQARVGQGVAAAFELREASEQLDRSRLNLVQSLHDYLAARSEFQLAIGLEPGETW